MLVELNGASSSGTIPLHYRSVSLMSIARVTAIADKLGVEFAIIHKKRNGRSLSAPEHMEILVGDVKDKVILSMPCFI